jgi:hypothetical protein
MFILNRRDVSKLEPAFCGLRASLEKAFEYRSGDLIYLKTDPIYDRLRREPRFEDLVRRIGFQT